MTRTQKVAISITVSYNKMMSGSKAHIAQLAAAMVGLGPVKHEQVATIVADCECFRGARTRSVERLASSLGEKLVLTPTS